MNERPIPRMTSILALDDLGVSLSSSETREVSLQRFIVALDRAMRADGGPQDEGTLADLLSQLLTSALKALSASDGALLVVDDETSDLVFVLSRGEVPEEDLAWKRLAPATGIAGWVAEHGETAVVFDAKNDPRFHDAFDTDFNFTTRTVLATPIVREGRIIGVLEALNKAQGEGFSKNDEALMSAASAGCSLLLGLLSSTSADSGG